MSNILYIDHNEIEQVLYKIKFLKFLNEYFHHYKKYNNEKFIYTKYLNSLLAGKIMEKEINYNFKNKANIIQFIKDEYLNEDFTMQEDEFDNLICFLTSQVNYYDDYFFLIKGFIFDSIECQYCFSIEDDELFDKALEEKEDNILFNIIKKMDLNIDIMESIISCTYEADITLFTFYSKTISDYLNSLCIQDYKKEIEKIKDIFQEINSRYGYIVSIYKDDKDEKNYIMIIGDDDYFEHLYYIFYDILEYYKKCKEVIEC